MSHRHWTLSGGPLLGFNCGCCLVLDCLKLRQNVLNFLFLCHNLDFDLDDGLPDDIEVLRVGLLHHLDLLLEGGLGNHQELLVVLARAGEDGRGGDPPDQHLVVVMMMTI